MPMLTSDYRAPGWCPGSHLQTVVPARLAPRPKVKYRREIVETFDEDVVAWDWAVPEPASPVAPVLVHFHGLEGASNSHYAEALMAACIERGWRGVVAHFRTCGGITNRKPRAYFAGDTTDNRWVLETVHARFPEAPLYAVGVSLGGNQLSKCLGDCGTDLSFVKAAVSVCGPLDLVAGSERVGMGANTLYADMFLKTLKAKLAEKAKRWPGIVCPEDVERCRTMYDFDQIYTAPVHGFRSAMEYWQKCSAKPALGGVRVPLLLLNARNDPFLSPWYLPKESEVSSDVYLEYPDAGGHVGFPTGRFFPGNIRWLPDRIMRFFDAGG